MICYKQFGLANWPKPGLRSREGAVLAGYPVFASAESRQGGPLRDRLKETV